MLNRRDVAALVLSGLMIGGVGAVVAFGHRQPVTPQDQTADSGGLKIPTVEEMCKTLGAIEGDALKQCRDQEQAAGEFVIAWMGLNGFIVNGELSLGQIQLLASLDDNGALSGLGPDPAAGFDPSLGFDPNADPSLLGDPSASGSQITSGIDPLTGAPLGYLQSPAQLALFCLQMAGDWVTLHDCISENDPSSHIGGVQ
jgi:hypothetical protein